MRTGYRLESAFLETACRKQGTTPGDPNQARVSGSACIRAGEGFLYLSLITGGCSRKTADYRAGDTLKAEGARRAPNRVPAALLPGAFPARRSDRGSRYCPIRHIEKLKTHGLPISMT